MTLAYHPYVSSTRTALARSCYATPDLLTLLKLAMTQRCALRALHRNRRHGRSVTRVPQDIIDRYILR